MDFPFFDGEVAGELEDVDPVTGGSGRKYNVYAEARRLAIERTLGINEEMPNSCGM